MGRKFTIALITLPCLAGSLWLICWALWPDVFHMSQTSGRILGILLLTIYALVIAFFALLVFAGVRCLWKALRSSGDGV